MRWGRASLFLPVHKNGASLKMTCSHPQPLIVDSQSNGPYFTESLIFYFYCYLDGTTIEFFGTPPFSLSLLLFFRFPFFERIILDIGIANRQALVLGSFIHVFAPSPPFSSQSLSEIKAFPRSLSQYTSKLPLLLSLIVLSNTGKPGR